MRIRQLEKKDIPFILEWTKDPAVNCFFRFDPEKITSQTIEQFIIAAHTTKQDIHLACVDDNDEYLGTISLKNIDRAAKTAEYATSFRAKAQGIGAAQYATDQILAIAFGDMALERIYLNVLEYNARARRFYEKNGFVYEGLFRSHLCVQGKRVGLCWYGLLKGEYDARKCKSCSNA